MIIMQFCIITNPIKQEIIRTIKLSHNIMPNNIHRTNFHINSINISSQ